MTEFEKYKKGADEKKADPKRIKALFTARAFRVGIYSTFASLVVIAIAIVAILITDKLPSTYTKLDITNNQMYTLSDQTKQIVGGLENDVNIYLIAQSENEDAGLKKLLERYEALNDKIHVTYKDPVLNPSFTQQYTAETVTENSLIVVSGERSQYVSVDEIYVSNFDYASYSSTTDFNGESSLTSAIDYVTSESLPKVYTLSGHGEKELSAAAQTAIGKENIDTASLNLLTVDAVPEDAECVIVFGPTADLTAAEKDQLTAYLENGGNLLLITDYADTAMPNFDALMANYGVETAKGIVVEGDANYCVNQYAHYLLPDIGTHEITQPLIDGGYYILMPISEGIDERGDVRGTVTITKLLTTSDKAFAKTAGLNATTMEKEEGDISGPFNLGVAITDKIGETETKIVWYTTSYLLDEQIDAMVSGGNLDLFINSIDWMCQRENSISIRPKSLASERLTIPAASGTRWTILIVGLIPLAFLGYGILVWVRRKRR